MTIISNQQWINLPFDVINKINNFSYCSRQFYKLDMDFSLNDAEYTPLYRSLIYFVVVEVTVF